MPIDATQPYDDANIFARILRGEIPAAKVYEDEHALAFNSGMAACYALFRVFAAAGDHIVAQHALYHEISDQLAADRLGCGVEATFVDATSRGRSMIPVAADAVRCSAHRAFSDGQRQRDRTPKKRARRFPPPA